MLIAGKRSKHLGLIFLAPDAYKSNQCTESEMSRQLLGLLFLAGKKSLIHGNKRMVRSHCWLKKNIFS